MLTDGGAPNARQRLLLNAILKDPSPPVAIVSSSLVARAVVTAMGWFNPRVRAFAEGDLQRRLRPSRRNRGGFACAFGRRSPS